MKSLLPRKPVLRAMRRQGGLGRFPFEISWGAFTPGLMETCHAQTGATAPPDEYCDFDTRSVNLNSTRHQTDFSQYFDEPLPRGVIFDEWGVGMLPGGTEHCVEFTFHPLAAAETPGDIADFKWPDVTASYRYDGLREQVAGYEARGYTVTGELYQTIYEMAWLMRGMETLMMDDFVNAKMAHALCERLTSLRVEQARIYARLGVDILRLGDYVCMQTGLLLGLDIYRKFIKERTRAIVAAAKEIKPDILVVMHCDGCVDEMVDEYIEIGIEIVNAVQPECTDLAGLARKYGRRISFWGGIGTQRKK